MASLEDALTGAGKKEAVVRDSLDVIDAEVADKSGLTGMAIKAAYKTVRGLRPDFVDRAVADLLPEFARALDPLYQEALQSGTPVGDFLRRNADRAANALLAITDGKAQRSRNRVVKGAYDKLRGTAEKHVVAAMPRVASLVERHAGA